MTAIAKLTEEECYLAAIFDDPSGVELAELTWIDEEQPDRCYRIWDFQWRLYHCDEQYQIDKCARSIGKALDVDTPIPIPGGWTTMGQLRAGDLVYGSGGQAVRVLAAHDVQHGRPCYEVVFDDEQRIVADEDHLWVTATKADVRSHHPGRARTTRSIGRTLLCAGEANHRIDVCGDLTGLSRTLPIPAYVLGVWLGDGTRVNNNVTLSDRDGPEIELNLKRHGYQLSGGHQTPGCRTAGLSPTHVTNHKRDSLGALLHGLDLSPAKFIPRMYLRADIATRRELLAGLMDTDGHVTKLSYAEYTSIDEQLARDLAELLRTLGQKPRITERRATLNGKDCGPCWRVSWRPTFQQCSVSFKVARFSEPTQPSRLRQRRIAAVNPVASRPVRCITVGAPDRLYLAGEGMIPTHNTYGIIMRAFVFPFANPGQEMLVTAPELNHLRPVVDKIENLFMTTRLGREMLPNVKGNGINHQPQFQARFRNNSRIVSRLPNRDGKGVKGQHPLKIELDEGQDYPRAGYVEIIETMKTGTPGAQWRVHGVSRGVRDTYYELTEGKNPDLPFHVHTYIAAHRPTWSDAERRNKIALYGGTEENPDYKRNILGEHGDAYNPLFVLARLMAVVRNQESAWATNYNSFVYSAIRINDELHRRVGLPIRHFLEVIPANHLSEEYSSYWGGMDVGYTSDPSEILIWGVVARPGRPDLLRQLLRVQLRRISARDQADAVKAIFAHYGDRLRRLGIDKTGNGLPLFQFLREDPEAVALGVTSRLAGYGFSEKLPVEFEDREPVGREKMADLVIERNIVDYASDELRKLVDAGAVELPYDVDQLKEFQGETVEVVKDMGNAAGIRKKYKGGCHTADAQVLTHAGWVRFADYVENPTTLAQWRDGALEMVEPEAIIEKPFTGDLVRYTNSHRFVSLTTPDHLVPGARDGKVDFKPAVEGFGRGRIWPRAGIMDGPGVPLSDDELAFQVAFSADGTIGTERHWARFGFAKQRKVDRLASLLDRLGWHYRRTQSRPGALTYFRVDVRAHPWVQRLFDIRWLTHATAAQREVLVGEIEHWDGSRNGAHRVTYSTTEDVNAEWVQTLAHTDGRVATMVKCARQWQVTIRRRVPGTSWDQLCRTEVPHDGLVYCVQVPSGAYLVRQEGCISMIHNCHTLDAARMLIAAKQLQAIEATLAPRRSGPVLDAFVG